MKLGKAIEILIIHNDHNPNYADADRRDAYQMGIDALKRVQDMRLSPCTTADEILPGETKDEPKTTFDPSISTVSTGEGKMP